MHHNALHSNTHRISKMKKVTKIDLLKELVSKTTMDNKN